MRNNTLYGLGKLYLNKDFAGVDTQKAVNYLTSAAEKGHSYAQYALGKLFLTGEKATRSAYYALYWLEKAAKQDNTDAQCLLGKVLLRGEITDQNTDQAAALLCRLLREIAEQFNSLSQKNRR